MKGPVLERPSHHSKPEVVVKCLPDLHISTFCSVLLADGAVFSSLSRTMLFIALLKHRKRRMITGTSLLKPENCVLSLVPFADCRLIAILRCLLVLFFFKSRQCNKVILRRIAHASSGSCASVSKGNPFFFVC